MAGCYSRFYDTGSRANFLLIYQLALEQSKSDMSFSSYEFENEVNTNFLNVISQLTIDIREPQKFIDVTHSDTRTSCHVRPPSALVLMKPRIACCSPQKGQSVTFCLFFFFKLLRYITERKSRFCTKKSYYPPVVVLRANKSRAIVA